MNDVTSRQRKRENAALLRRFLLLQASGGVVSAAYLCLLHLASSLVDRDVDDVVDLLLKSASATRTTQGAYQIKRVTTLKTPKTPQPSSLLLLLLFDVVQIAHMKNVALMVLHVLVGCFGIVDDSYGSSRRF